jgi:hypothetical protein
MMLVGGGLWLVVQRAHRLSSALDEVLEDERVGVKAG